MAISQEYIYLPDALRAMEKAIHAIITLSGKAVDDVMAVPDHVTGTASVRCFEREGKANVIVHFPAAVATTRISRAERDRWTGYFLHEVAHVLYTDFSNGGAWVQARNEGIQNVVNGLEDVRIEGLLIASQVSDNARPLLENLTAWAEREMVEKVKNYNPNNRKYLPWTLAYLGRWSVLKYPLALAPHYYQMLTDPAIHAALSDLSRAKSTMDCLDIARALLATKPVSRRAKDKIPSEEQSGAEQSGAEQSGAEQSGAEQSGA
ncbi:MAG: hypothetical protein N2444_08435, partial [Methylocystis sp.]|nr:hypothetical protein [Methylocystis sp.]